jgi:hypothetical protein
MQTEQTMSASNRQDELKIPNNPVGSVTPLMASPVAAPTTMISWSGRYRASHRTNWGRLRPTGTTPCSG